MDDTSFLEGSIVDFLDFEEILRKIFELADDFEELDDCFIEGKVVVLGFFILMLIGLEFGLVSIYLVFLCLGFW